MKCPSIKEECWGSDCVRWNKEKGKCQEQVQGDAYELMTKEVNQYTQMVGYYHLVWKLSLAQLMRDPTIPQEVKEALQQAQDAQTAEKLLKDAGLL
ncbi:hypothetical protein ES703_66183 [subsurface metagenome]